MSRGAIESFIVTYNLVTIVLMVGVIILGTPVSWSFWVLSAIVVNIIAFVLGMMATNA